MERVKILETELQFSRPLTRRGVTNLIVVHHTGGAVDSNQGAMEIHDWHIKQNGWAGIGYHFVIRKNGIIERGRPLWAVGAHAEGQNYRSIGIHLSGNFNLVQPTAAQIESAAMLIANLASDYRIEIDRAHVVGHGELMATSCPGTFLQALIDDTTITGKANFYRYA